MDKRSLRRENFARIKALSDDEKASFSQSIVSHISNFPRFREANIVFSYVAMASEPDLDELRQLFPEKTWALSRVAEDGKSLHFHEVGRNQLLIQSRLGFEEPDPDTCPVITNPDLILIPGVGFDPSRNARLGRGKGHYDRYLAPLISSDTPPVLVGVSFAAQWRELVVERHDVSMDFLVSEEKIV